VSQELNTLCTALREACAEAPLREKWLVAPTIRIGIQWLDAVARAGQPVLQVHVKTLPGVALGLASAVMEDRGVELLRGLRRDVVVDRVFGRLEGRGARYLAGVEPSPGLVRALAQSIQDLRMGGVVAAALDPATFEVAAKGREIQILLREYEAELEAHGLVDRADVLRMAIQRLRGDPSSVPEDALVLLPADLEPTRLERELVEAIPAARRRVLPVDEPELAGAGASSARLLGWVQRPAEAPEAPDDDTVRLFQAVGEVNEVREVFRRCAEQGIPYDEVEVLHTDAETYVPLLYEVGTLLQQEGGALPLTFVEGLPARYSRPGRALQAWLEWVRGDHPQAHLVQMIQDGLLVVPARGEGSPNLGRLAAVLKAVPIGSGRDRYDEALQRQLDAVEARLGPGYEPDPDPARERRRREGLEHQAERLRTLRTLVRALLALLPAGTPSQAQVLEAAVVFLRRHARPAGSFDEYCRGSLVEVIEGLTACLGEEEILGGLDVWGWLGELPASTRVRGQGPRPGQVVVSSLAGGGHSGRPHTFLLGLDDTRFPGAGLQDPLLLDNERSRIDPELPTTTSRQAARLDGLARLLARLRGTITLGYCCHDLADDREMFPSPVLLAAYRIVTGDREGDQQDLLAWLPPPASFAPAAEARCADPQEWWLWRLCGADAVEDPEAVIGQEYPHLARGFRARDARASDRFTEYDGFVPEAGPVVDPTREGGSVVSASRLERFGKCPLEFFFTYVLGITPPEEYTADPDQWLDPASKGGLLHGVFQEFMAGLVADGLQPEFPRDRERMAQVLARWVERYRIEIPPPSPEVFERQRGELEQTTRIFLQEEQGHCRTHRPVGFETAIGLPREDPGLLDSPEPVEVALPGGGVIRVRGQIDRIDERIGDGAGRFVLWDYKAGCTWAFEQGGDDPFWAGRRVQNLIYLLLVEAQLHRTMPSSRVDAFGYFFPGVKAQGERIQWTAAELRGGVEVLQRLCTMLASGSFPMTDSAGDLTFTDHGAAFGNLERAVADARRKLGNPDNEALRPMQELRGYATDDE